MGITEGRRIDDEDKPLLLDSARAYAVTRQINFKILPIFLLMATLCYIDRTNTAFASLQMNRDLKFSAETYGLGSGLFFVGYSLAMIPSQFILMRVGAPRWLSCIVTLWGLTAMMFSRMTNKVHFCILRIFLGVFESGAFPGMWYYLNCFYPPDAITLPYSLVEAAVGVANVAGAPVAAGLLMMDGTGGWAGWRWLFLIEGLPSVCTGIAMLFILPRDFQSATFFTAADKVWLTQAHAVSKKQQPQNLETAANLKPTALLRDAARNHKIWLCGITALLKNAAMVGILFWAPIIVNSILTGSSINMSAGTNPATSGVHGHRQLAAAVAVTIHRQDGDSSNSTAEEKGVTAVLLTAIPFIAAAVSAVLLGHRSQQQREKCRHVAVPYCIAALLFILFPYIVRTGGVATFVCLTLAITTLTAPNAVLNSLASSVSSGPSSAVSLALYNAVGNLGGLLGPWLIGKVVQGTGLYAAALQVLGGMIGIAAGLCWWMYTKWRL